MTFLFPPWKNELVVWPMCLVIPPHKDVNVAQMNLPLLYTGKSESEGYLHVPRVENSLGKS